MELEQAIKFFKAHNRSRIERLIELAPPKQRVFYQLLPLLFESKAKQLPGYTKNAPFGIVDYQPSSAIVDVAKKTFSGFSYTPHSLPFYPILGVYLLNDLGSLSYPKQPSHELWVVYRSTIPEEHTKLLKEKLRLILNWANSLGIRIKAKLLNDAAVAEHNVADDDLDRFYSSGLIMGGSLPLWWLISSRRADDYAQNAKEVLESGIIRDSMLDFGPLRQRKPETVIDRAVLACSETIKYGLPSFLELIYQKTVLKQFSSHDFWLSDQYKNNVYGRESDPFFCEPLLLKFKVLTTSFHADLTEHIRQSLYMLCGEKISIQVKNPVYPWRRESVAHLVNSWRWQISNMTVLDNHNRSKLRSRLEEFQLISQYTADFIADLKQFVKTHAPEQANKVSALEKQYRNAFNSAEDVIPRLPASLLPEESEEHLTLEFDTSDNCWTINEVDRTQIPQEEEFNPLGKHRSLVRLLAWTILNGALSRYTRVKLITNNSPVSLQTVNALVPYMVNSPLASMADMDKSTFNWLMFANVEVTPDEAYKQQNMKLSIRLRDPLNYGYHRRNLVMQLEVLVSSNQQDWHYIHYNDDNATGEVLASLIRWHEDPQANNYIDCWSPTPNFAESIKRRLTQVGQDIATLHQSAPENGTYLMEIADRLSRVQWQDGAVDASVIASRYDLMSLLGQPRAIASKTVVDTHLDPEGLYSLLLADQASQQLQFYIHTQKNNSDIYIVDELGVLYKQRFTNLRETTIVGHYNKFLTQVAQINKHQPPIMYNLEFQLPGSWSRELIEFFPVPQKDHFSAILIEMAAASFDSDCTIYCAGKQFNGKANDPALLKQVRTLIENMRSSKANYPFYITNIKLPEEKRYRSSHFLVIKQKLEKLLNANG